MRNEGRELEAKVTPLRNHPEKEGKPGRCLNSQQTAGRGGSRKAAAESPARKGSPQAAHISEPQRLENARPPKLRLERPDEAEDSPSLPLFWVSKWMDHTGKRGLGYQLCDNSIGVFNDTRVILLNNMVSVTYVDDNSVDHYRKVEDYAPSLEEKLLCKNISARR